MKCNQSIFSADQEYLEQFNKKVTEQRIPLSGSFNITHRCNMRCAHCYVSPQKAAPESAQKELSTGQIVSLLDDIARAGCLYLLITGGEPLLRRDFQNIYRHAKQNGLLVTVFTNGTLVTEDIVELFSALPPIVVEISLYGATPEVHEKITGVKGSFTKCISGIESLLDRKIQVRLKTILMTCNRHELLQMEKIAHKYRVKFRMDASIFPCLDGDHSPLLFRLPPEDAVEIEFSNGARSKQWNDYYQRMKDTPASDRLYNCGAGLTNFHIDPYGNLQPCLMTPGYQYNLLNGSFREGWLQAMPRIHNTRADDASQCVNCEKRMLCGYCPAFFYLETGAEDIVSEYICKMGQQRYHLLRKNGV
jgi:radical SAM protein with 4Fe4S-binding SPASM domain